MNRSVMILSLIGASQLVVGLLISLFIALQVSWLLGLILAFGFFTSANILFFVAWQKLNQKR